MNATQSDEFPSVYQPPVFAKPAIVKQKETVSVRNDRAASVIFDAARVVLQPGRVTSDQTVIAFRLPFRDAKAPPARVTLHFRLAVDKESEAWGAILLNVGDKTDTLFYPTGGGEIHREILREVVVEGAIAGGEDLPVTVVLSGGKRHRDAYCLLTLHSVDFLASA